MLQKLFAVGAVLFLLVFMYLTSGTINPPDRSKKTIINLKTAKSGPLDESVFERGLIVEEPNAREILLNHAAYYKDVALRRFNGTVLGYVTAWHSHGYDVAKTFGKKFDIISPVWFQIRKNKADNSYVLAGEYDIDADWLRSVRQSGKTKTKSTKIFPRALFDQFSNQDFSRLLTFEEDRARVNDLLVNLCLEHEFDGIVLEFWSHLAGRIDDQYLYTLIIEMVQALKKHNLRLILVIPPFRSESPKLFAEEQMNMLYKHVYAFSLMTYDFSTFQRPGANSPMYWVRRCIEEIAPNKTNDVKAKRRKILMGLNMYGYDYTPDGGGPIIGEKYLELVQHVKKGLAYDERDVENYFEVRTDTGRHIVFYPTLNSINERIKLAQEMGVGISIWELGQGLDYFYDLF